jgi:pimeloyl-ACP methyl ester carboxylesterase
MSLITTGLMMGTAPAAKLETERMVLDVNGVETVVHAAGDPAAPPLVYFHGAGTFHGAEFAAAWTDRFRVLMPYHPGFGESGDDDSMREVHDLVLHYTELFDLLGLTHDVNLVGLSLGGLLASRFAIEQQHRLRRLVLCCPAGLTSPNVHQDDLFTIPPEQLPPRLVARMETLIPWFPADPMDVDFTVARYRESRTVAMLLWDHPHDRVLPRWLGRIRVPTRIVWGAEDALIPPGFGPEWQALIPGSELRTYADAGHLVLDESPAAVADIAQFCQ